MGDVASNNFVASRVDYLFANGPGVQVPFTGRTAETKAVREAAQRHRDGILLVSEPFGTGKTMLLEHITKVSSAFLGGSPALDALPHMYVDAEQLKEAAESRLVLIDEADTRNAFEDVFAQLKVVTSFVSEHEVLTILAGDYFLLNPRVTDEIKSLVRMRIELKPLAQDFLLDVLDDRLCYVKNLPKPGVNLDRLEDGAPPRRVESIVAPDLLEVLVPSTNPPTAVARGVLGVLREFAPLLPSNENPCVLDEGIAEEWLKKVWLPQVETSLRPDQRKVYDSLRRMVASCLEEKKPVPVLSPEVLREHCGFTEEQARDRKFLEEVIDPMVRIPKPILTYSGIPDEKTRRPPPYMASVPVFIDARFGQDER